MHMQGSALVLGRARNHRGETPKSCVLAVRKHAEGHPSSIQPFSCGVKCFYDSKWREISEISRRGRVLRCTSRSRQRSDRFEFSQFHIGWFSTLYLKQCLFSFFFLALYFRSLGLFQYVFRYSYTWGVFLLKWFKAEYTLSLNIFILIDWKKL